MMINARKGLAIFAVLVMASIATLNARADDPVKVPEGNTNVGEDKMGASRGDGADENIKKPEEKNDPKAVKPKPAEKGGDKTRGGLAGVKIDNRTPYVVKIYYSGEYMGSVGSFGDGAFYSTPGRATIYARADFTDGTVKTVGPRTAQIDAGTIFTWTIGE